jgi:hypothetical protein
MLKDIKFVPKGFRKTDLNSFLKGAARKNPKTVKRRRNLELQE